DITTFHNLTVAKCINDMFQLLSMRKDELPQTALTNLIIQVNYFISPPQFWIKNLDNYKIGRTDGSEVAIARSNVMVERVQANPNNYILIESTVPVGQLSEVVITLASNIFYSS
ncbi:hypothetical protein C8Q75DRAFT_705925, partial [Abortiporus biennis]